VGILRGFDAETVRWIGTTLADSGLGAIEVTLNTKGALDQLQCLLECANNRLNIGVGTVLTMEQARDAIRSGAQFVVTPVVVPEVIRYCKDEGVPIFPGALTPTEVFTAWTNGADLVKIFPAEFGGAAYLKAIKAPLNQVRLMPTGGVRPENIGELIASGAEAFGVGTPLFAKERMINRDTDWILAQVKAFKTAYDAR
jgi:2-dehydro-3-deoxyphosphogluconate aldolase/(4S)-4-hydroxy-2-oxoglutarate aldolase